MTNRTTGLTFAVACLTAIATMPAHSQTAATYGTTAGQQSDTSQASRGDVPQSASARQNVIESHQYDRALETNRAFRQTRMRKECGPISDPELRQSCLSSFHQDEPSAGSSSSSRAQRGVSGR